MKKYLPLLIFLFIFLTSCLSVNLKPNDPTPLRTLGFITPPSWQFKKIKIQDENHHFQSQVTGNLISIQSHCPSSSQNLAHDLSSSLTQVQFDSKILPYQIDERIVTETLIDGLKESVPLKIRLIQYEKLGCKISAFYLAQESQYPLEVTDFETLIKTLRAKK